MQFYSFFYDKYLSNNNKKNGGNIMSGLPGAVQAYKGGGLTSFPARLPKPEQVAVIPKGLATEYAVLKPYSPELALVDKSTRRSVLGSSVRALSLEGEGGFDCTPETPHVVNNFQYLSGDADFERDLKTDPRVITALDRTIPLSVPPKTYLEMMAEYEAECGDIVDSAGLIRFIEKCNNDYNALTGGFAYLTGAQTPPATCVLETQGRFDLQARYLETAFDLLTPDEQTLLTDVVDALAGTEAYASKYSAACNPSQNMHNFLSGCTMKKCGSYPFAVEVTPLQFEPSFCYHPELDDSILSVVVSNGESKYPDVTFPASTSAREKANHYSALAYAEGDSADNYKSFERLGAGAHEVSADALAVTASIASVEALDGRVSVVDGRVSDVDGRVSVVDGSLGVLRANITTIDEDLSFAFADIGTLDSNGQALRSHIVGPAHSSLSRMRQLEVRSGSMPFVSPFTLPGSTRVTDALSTASSASSAAVTAQSTADGKIGWFSFIPGIVVGGALIAAPIIAISSRASKQQVDNLTAAYTQVHRRLTAELSKADFRDNPQLREYLKVFIEGDSTAADRVRNPKIASIIRTGVLPTLTSIEERYEKGCWRFGNLLHLRSMRPSSAEVSDLQAVLANANTKISSIIEGAHLPETQEEVTALHGNLQALIDFRTTNPDLFDGITDADLAKARTFFSIEADDMETRIFSPDDAEAATHFEYSMPGFDRTAVIALFRGSDTDEAGLFKTYIKALDRHNQTAHQLGTHTATATTLTETIQGKDATLLTLAGELETLNTQIGTVDEPGPLARTLTETTQQSTEINRTILAAEQALPGLVEAHRAADERKTLIETDLGLKNTELDELIAERTILAGYDEHGDHPAGSTALLTATVASLTEQSVQLIAEAGDDAAIPAGSLQELQATLDRLTQEHTDLTNQLTPLNQAVQDLTNIDEADKPEDYDAQLLTAQQAVTDKETEITDKQAELTIDQEDLDAGTVLLATLNREAETEGSFAYAQAALDVATARLTALQDNPHDGPLSLITTATLERNTLTAQLTGATQTVVDQQQTLDDATHRLEALRLQQPQIAEAVTTAQTALAEARASVQTKTTETATLQAELDNHDGHYGLRKRLATAEEAVVRLTAELTTAATHRDEIHTAAIEEPEHGLSAIATFDREITEAKKSFLRQRSWFREYTKMVNKMLKEYEEKLGIHAGAAQSMDARIQAIRAAITAIPVDDAPFDLLVVDDMV